MAATRGYQMAQIFLKELVRDTSTVAATQQAQVLQLQNSLQAANAGAGSLGSLSSQNALQAGLAAQQGLRTPQFNTPLQVRHMLSIPRPMQQEISALLGSRATFNKDEVLLHWHPRHHLSPAASGMQHLQFFLTAW